MQAEKIFLVFPPKIIIGQGFFSPDCVHCIDIDSWLLLSPHSQTAHVRGKPQQEQQQGLFTAKC